MIKVECPNKESADKLESSLKYWDHMDTFGVRIKWKQENNIFIITDYSGDSIIKELRGKGRKISQQKFVRV